MKIVGITACPTGVAHTYMAQEALEKKAIELGHEVKIETQGSIGIENELSQKEIDVADVIIFAVGIPIEGEERFEGRRILKVSIGEAVSNPEQVIKKAEVF